MNAFSQFLDPDEITTFFFAVLVVIFQMLAYIILVNKGCVTHFTKIHLEYWPWKWMLLRGVINHVRLKPERVCLPRLVLVFWSQIWVVIFIQTIINLVVLLFRWEFVLFIQLFRTFPVARFFEVSSREMQEYWSHACKVSSAYHTLEFFILFNDVFLVYLTSFFVSFDTCWGVFENFKAMSTLTGSWHRPTIKQLTWSLVGYQRQFDNDASCKGIFNKRIVKSFFAPGALHQTYFFFHFYPKIHSDFLLAFFSCLGYHLSSKKIYKPDHIHNYLHGCVIHQLNFAFWL